MANLYPIHQMVKVSNAAAYSESRTATAVMGVATSAYQEWISTQGLDGTDIAPSADADGDLRNNLLEYATGSTARLADATPPVAMTAGSVADSVEFQLTLRGDPGLRLFCLLSSDLTSWMPVALEFRGGHWFTGDPLLQVAAAQAARARLTGQGPPRATRAKLSGQGGEGGEGGEGLVPLTLSRAQFRGEGGEWYWSTTRHSTQQPAYQ